jgi:two-component system, chemotaxis family, chemotaxis protein CheY
MRVMIVDDSRTARLMLKKALPAALLADLIEVTGGAEALARCQAEKIDLMFLDLTMPDRTGYEVLEALRARGAVPVTVVVSADAQPRAQERVQALGALAFMKKPPARADLERVLREAGVL